MKYENHRECPEYRRPVDDIYHSSNKRMSGKKRIMTIHETLVMAMIGLSFSVLCFKGIGCLVNHYSPTINEQVIEQTIEPTESGLEIKIE